MLGHKLWQTLSPQFETYATFRSAPETLAHFKVFDQSRMLGGVSVEEFATVVRAIATTRPDVVVNCVGIVKQSEAINSPINGITVNALFPHRLAQLCGETGARLIHLSTDCVFSGRKGNYRETDTKDAEDLYGRTKALGEVDDGSCLTIRTSMIGRELQRSQGLIEWFLGQKGKTVPGFKRAVFTGLTTAALSEVIGNIIENQPQLRGLWHVAGDPISKFDLLELVNKVFALNVNIEPDETFVCDRSLDHSRFREATGFTPPLWPEMIELMRHDITPYEEARSTHAD